MKFGRFPLAECKGTILAHSLRLPGLVVKKGTRLTDSHMRQLAEQGIDDLTVARLDEGDVPEDEAARRIADAMVIDGIGIAEAGTGRVNFHAGVNGIFRVSRDIVNAVNSIDPAITFATLSEHEPVEAGRMVATVKIIPYAISGVSLEAVFKVAAKGEAMAVSSYRARKIAVISTRLAGLKDRTIEKTIDVLEKRLAGTGSSIVEHSVIAHDQDAVQGEIRRLAKFADFIILFGASAISDLKDVIPAALVDAGGKVLRFGMPVDPGNLLMLGEIDGKPVLGAPGCARSPAENGFDFVLNRLLADVDVTSGDIAAMGVGGLLMEIGSRPQPRQPSEHNAIEVTAVILAAGQSRRMGSENKLTLEIRGKPMVRHAVEAAQQAGLKNVVVVTGHESGKVQAALSGLDVEFVHNDAYDDGLSASLQTGISALGYQTTHALILLGDMPAITGPMIAKMLDAAGKSPASSIIMATHNGKRGNPVLWPRSYFDALAKISGDTGARHIIGQHRDQVVEVELGLAASQDIDTPQALAAFQKEYDV